jgi:hypothetical protein
MTREIVIGVALLASGAARPRQYHGPKCLGSYCLRREIRVASILKQLGPTPKISPFSSYCYRSPGGTLFLYVEGSEENPPTVDAVFISDGNDSFRDRQGVNRKHTSQTIDHRLNQILTPKPGTNPLRNAIPSQFRSENLSNCRVVTHAHAGSTRVTTLVTHSIQAARWLSSAPQSS